MTSISATPTLQHRAGYRPELDGLRTVAVMVVVAFHAGIGWMHGGFIGVDVFFVLSGFLITGLLVDDHGKGSFSLSSFYARRSRRLLPAATVVIVAISLGWLMTASVIERAPLQRDATAASLYFSNWRFAFTSTDYFAAANAPSPFMHFWSLSAEEQFYFVWPAIVALVFWIARRQRRSDSGRRASRGVLLVAAVLGPISLASLWWTDRTGNASLAYFGTHNRAYQLLGGAALAVLARSCVRTHDRLRIDPVGQVVACVALLVLASSAVDIGPSVRGVLTAAMTLALLWTLERGGRHPISRVLASRPMVALGKVSYGVYLWHWPVLLVLRRFATHQTTLLLLGGTVISVLLAEASNRFLEMPIRTSSRLGRHSGAVVALGVAMSVVVGVVAAPSVLGLERKAMFVADRPSVVVPPTVSSGSSPTSSPGSEPPATTPVPSLDVVMSQTVAGPHLHCISSKVRGTCLVHRGTSGRTVLVIGDSHLQGFKHSFATFGATHNVTVYLWMEFGCPWQPDLFVLGKWTEKCVPRKQLLYDTVLPAMHPDAVIAVNDAYDDRSYPRAMGIGPQLVASEPAPALIAALPLAAAQMMKFTRQFVVIRPWPSLPFNQRDCLASATSVKECSGSAITPLPSDATLFATAARTPGMSIVDLNTTICPRLPTCDAVIDGHIVRMDQDHLTYDFGHFISSELERRLVALGVFG